MKRVAGSGRRRCESERARRCCVMGRSECHMQKKRPFQSLRSSSSVKGREDRRYVRRESRAFSRVGRSIWGVVSSLLGENKGSRKVLRSSATFLQRA